MINKKQCTILWHVDDLKISHIDAAVNTEVIEMINKEFGKEALLTINRGKVHDYLSMTLDFMEEGKAARPRSRCWITLKRYLPIHQRKWMAKPSHFQPISYLMLMKSHL